MCGRFTQMMTWRAVWELYQIRLPLPEEDLRPIYNVARYQGCPVVRRKPSIRFFVFGLALPDEWGPRHFCLPF